MGYLRRRMIKNYTSTTTNTFAKIQKILATHGAKRMMFDYTDDGKIETISFSLKNILPLVNGSSRSKSFIRVVFPAPDLPTIETNSLA